MVTYLAHTQKIEGSTPSPVTKGLCLVDLYTNYLTVVLYMDYP